jgi:TonB-linked SusC/RagA family outer membrane protein
MKKLLQCDLSRLFGKALKPLLGIWFLTLLSVSVYGQERTVTGTVINPEDNSGLPGVSVVAEGTSVGTITNVDGSYKLVVPEGVGSLVFSSIGYKTQTVSVGSRSVIDIEMMEDLMQLEEIVVIGYGAQKRVNLSGAVETIDSKVLENRPIQSVGQGLQGAVPNLNIDFQSGEPGSSPTINIRGLSTISGNGDPLILVDNIPTSIGELNFIAPSDIANITVLKDASSAAIYGARAAYGVILITTKTGKEGKPVVTYNNNFSWGKPTVLPDKITDPYIYMRLNENSVNNTPWDNIDHTDDMYAWARDRSNDPSSSDPVRINPNDAGLYQYMGNKDWTKHFLDNPTFSQRQNIAVSGKKESTSYYISGAYDNQNGSLQLADDQFDRYGLKGKVDIQLNDHLTIGNNTTLSLTEREKPYYLSIFDMYNLAPTDWDKNPDGTWANTETGRLGARLTNGGNTSDKDNFLQSKFNAGLSFLENTLTVNTDFTVRRQNSNYSSNQTKYQIGYGPGDVREEGTNSAYRSAAFNSYYVYNLYGSYNPTFGRHSLGLTAGYNQEYNKDEWFSAQRTNVISASLPTIQLATGESFVGEGIADWAVRGLFYRVNYIFDGKYILELNGRYDGSSKFPKDKRWGFFPSASAAWNVDKEAFWSGLSEPVSMFKVRTSYGTLGNQQTRPEDIYGYISSMQATTGSYLIDGSLPTVVRSASLVSSNYTWEKVTSFNVGTDLGFLQNRITASYDYFIRNTTGMLIPGKQLPAVLGASAPNENAGDLQTKGWEMSVGYNDDFTVAGKPLTFNAKLNLSDTRSYITRFDNPSRLLTQYYEGQELGEMWGLQSDGFFRSTEEISNLDETTLIPWGALEIVEGWMKYKDLDGNGAIEKGTTVDDPKDLSVIGNIMPRMRYGINLSASWNGLDINAFFQGVGKMDYYPLHYLYWGFYQQPYAGGYNHLLDFYRATDDDAATRALHSQSYLDAGLADANTDAKYPVLQSWLADRNLGERIDEAQGLAVPQTDYMLNGAYLRLKNLTVGYTLPGTLTNRIGVASLRVYVSGENIATKSELKKFFDPEAVTDNINKTNPNASTSSGWGYAYPYQRRFSMGLNLRF